MQLMQIYVHTNHKNACKRSGKKYIIHSYKTIYFLCSNEEKKCADFQYDYYDVDFYKFLQALSRRRQDAPPCLLQNAPVLKSKVK
jgi:hypothetical protein